MDRQKEMRLITPVDIGITQSADFGILTMPLNTKTEWLTSKKLQSVR